MNNTTVHLSSFVLDQILTHECDRNEETIATHLTACLHCQTRLKHRENEDRDFFVAHPAPAMVNRMVTSEHRPRSIRGWLFWGGIPATATAMALVGILAFRPGEIPLSPNDHNSSHARLELRPRGTTTSRIRVMAVRDKRLVPLQNETALPEMTQLRFRIDTHLAHVCIFHRCGKVVSTLYDDRLQTRPHTQSWMMPGVFSLVQTPMRDEIILVQDDQTLDCTALLKQLKADGANRELGHQIWSNYDVIRQWLPRITSPKTHRGISLPNEKR